MMRVNRARGGVDGEWQNSLKDAFSQGEGVHGRVCYVLFGGLYLGGRLARPS